MIDFEYVFFALAAAVLYSAWHEHRADNPRDARLLAGVGLGSAAAAMAALVA